MSHQDMGPDLRLPIGFMFVAVAAILVIYGWREPAVHAPRTGFNINLYWGIVLLVFGVVMLALGAQAEARKKAQKNKLLQFHHQGAKTQASKSGFRNATPPPTGRT